jgi:LysM repeat protein
MLEHYFTSDICRLKLWIAYPTTKNVPCDNGKYTSWVGFQYGQGKIAGCDNNVDFDEFTKDILIPVPKPAPKPVPKPVKKIVYIAKKGDTLIGIAAKYKTTYEALAKLNNIKPPYTIYPGQKIKIN